MQRIFCQVSSTSSQWYTGPLKQTADKQQQMTIDKDLSQKFILIMLYLEELNEHLPFLAK